MTFEDYKDKIKSRILDSLFCELHQEAYTQEMFDEDVAIETAAKNVIAAMAENNPIV